MELRETLRSTSTVKCFMWDKKRCGGNVADPVNGTGLSLNLMSARFLASLIHVVLILRKQASESFCTFTPMPDTPPVVGYAASKMEQYSLEMDPEHHWSNCETALRTPPVTKSETACLSVYSFVVCSRQCVRNWPFGPFPCPPIRRCGARDAFPRRTT